MLQVKKLYKQYQGSRKQLIPVLQNFSLTIEPGEIVSLFGPNGCGKSTLIDIVAGLDQDYQGQVTISGQQPNQARIGYVFQNFRQSLFPWLTVSKNLELGLQTLQIEASEKEQKVGQMLDSLNLSSYASRYPYQLSGGLAQLVSIGRALIGDPEIILLDEAFSALDYHTSIQTMQIFLDLWSLNPKPVLNISHSADEAVCLSNRVLVLSNRPTSIVSEVKVNLPTPRHTKLLTKEEIQEPKSKVLDHFLR